MTQTIDAGITLTEQAQSKVRTLIRLKVATTFVFELQSSRAVARDLSTSFTSMSKWPMATLSKTSTELN
jgi:hypothetical protein